MPPWLNEAEQKAWLALLEVGSGLFDLLSRDLKKIAELVVEDYEVLHLLSQADEGRLRVGELADQMLASRTRLSQRLDRLGKRGLVSRSRCEVDRRAIDVVLTDQGAELLMEVAPLHLASVRRHVFDHLSTDDVDAIGGGLQKLAAYLHQQGTG